MAGLTQNDVGLGALRVICRLVAGRGRTLAHWHTAIVNWHHARVSNGPTAAINNLMKRVKRAAFGFRRFAHYRIRALLYAGKPNWTLLNGLTPR